MTVKKNDEKLFDLRTLDAFLTRGVLKPNELEKHLKALPDEEGNYEFVVIEEDEPESEESSAPSEE
ncbi:MAG: hypothetical protein U1F66_01735 [bacterium]